MNAAYNQYVTEFLDLKKIGVVGLSSTQDNPGNHIYKKLKDNGYEVYAINPKADKIKGEPCYPSVSAVPTQLEGVVIATHPTISESIIEECSQANIPYVWIHKSVGEGSYSQSAVDKAKKLGIKMIPNGCPMMFVKPDIIHRCMKFFMKSKFKV